MWPRSGIEPGPTGEEEITFDEVLFYWWVHDCLHSYPHKPIMGSSSMCLNFLIYFMFYLYLFISLYKSHKKRSSGVDNVGDRHPKCRSVELLIAGDHQETFYYTLLRTRSTPPPSRNDLFIRSDGSIDCRDFFASHLGTTSSNFMAPARLLWLASGGDGEKWESPWLGGDRPHHLICFISVMMPRSW